LTYNYSNNRKDIKFNIKVYKSGLPIGVTDLVISQLILAKRQESMSKMTNIIMPETIRKTLFNSYTNTTLKLNIKAKMSYSDIQLRSSSVKSGLSFGEDREGRSSSLNAVRGSVLKNASASPLKKYFNSPKKLSERLEVTNEIIPIQVDASTSFIDPVLNDENEGFAHMQELITDFNKNSEEFEVDEDNIDRSKEKAKELIRSLFTIQEAYSNQFNNQVYQHKQMKSLLINYNEKYRTIVKKTNKLKETLETFDMKNNLCNNVHREENNNIREKILATSKELNLFNSLFRIKYSAEDVYKYTEMKNSEDLKKEKCLLLDVYQNLTKKRLIDSIEPERKEIVEDIFSKYNLENENFEDEQSEEVVNRIVLDDDDEEEEENEVEQEPIQKDNKEPEIQDNNLKKQHMKRLTVIDSNIGDKLDYKLDNYLVNYYNKKRLSQIPLRRISAGNYEFGTQKIHVKCVGETIRGNKY
jgi:hypothetical protein